MPNIELDGTSNDIGWVMAVMLFPNNKELREQHFAVNRVRFELMALKEDVDCVGSMRYEDSRVGFDTRTIQLLLDAPSYTDIKRMADDNVKHAVVAADILSAIYLMSIFGIEEPSLNKAIHVIQQYAKLSGTRYGDGTQMFVSERYIREYWREFQPVAHLWAAQRINQSYPFIGQNEVFSYEGFPKFLEVAQGMFQFASNFVPKRAKPKEPILNQEKSWVIPLSIQPSNLESQRFPDGLKRFLKNYNAPQSKY